MAKDGVHTIDYQKLVDEREARQTAQSALQAAQAELAALRATPATPASPAPATPAQPAATGFDFEVDLGDFSETAIANGVKQAVASGVNARTTALEAQIKVLQDGLTAQQTAAVESEDEAHFKAISNAHPDVESVVVSKEFASWRDKQPAYAAHGITAVIEGGTAAQVIEALNAYKQATGVKTVVPVPTPAPGGAAPTATTDPAIQAAAQAAINAARSAAPVSLSDIPAGSAAHHDPVAAILDMSSTQQMQMMLGKTPEQIAAIVDKCL